MVEVYRRLEDNTSRYETLEPGSPKLLELPCLERVLSLEEIYRGVQF